MYVLDVIIKVMKSLMDETGCKARLLMQYNWFHPLLHWLEPSILVRYEKWTVKPRRRKSCPDMCAARIYLVKSFDIHR